MARDAMLLFVDGIGREMSDTWGRVSDLAGRIFAALYISGRPMDMDELAALLGRSKSNVLVNLRTLVELRLACRVWQPGSRRYLYTVGDDYGNIVLRAFLKRLEDSLEANRRAIDITGELLAAAERQREDAGQVAAMRARLETAAAFYESMQAMYAKLAQTIGFDADFTALLQQAASLLTEQSAAP